MEGEKITCENIEQASETRNLALFIDAHLNPSMQYILNASQAFPQIQSIPYIRKEYIVQTLH